MLLGGGEVCFVAMEMCAVCLPSPPVGSAHLKWPCPQLGSFRKLLEWEGGSGERAGMASAGSHHCVSGHCVPSGLSEEKLAPICALREVE